jgi:hypothetical protein
MENQIQSVDPQAKGTTKRRKPREKPLDLWWLRWLATVVPFVATALLIHNNGDMLYAWIPAAVFGGLLCIYFGHILLFRLQCGLFELLVMTAVLGLIEGLMLSTPGVTRIALWLSPLVLAWILYGAVVGLARARLLNATSTRASVLHMFAAWLGIAWMALAALSITMWSLSEQSTLVSPEMKAWCWPLFILAVIGLALDIWLGVKTSRRARAVLKSGLDSELNSAPLDAKP